MKEYIEAVDRGLEGCEYVSTGVCDSCDECPEIDECYFKNCIDCDACGTSMGGDVFSGHCIIDGELVHLEFCYDCVFYVNYGDLPETWEG